MRCSMFLNLVLKEPTFVEKSKKTNSEEVRLSATLCGLSAILPWRELKVSYSICSKEQLIGKRSFDVGTAEMSWAQLD